eukprot:TRINITY_DN5397_c0_g1_i5.p1 TRINITY_DN5397_c0_g1~~TRINITY_DN5397_c0_g1_i5.p1  ORF type:complete len:254 (+),score=93.51 TRINITY_DN5397_c0_g1_i5:145-906(+)
MCIRDRYQRRVRGLRLGAMGEPGTLTVDVVLKKTKASSLDEVRNINLWGCKLENLDVLSSMPAVEIVSLSVNNIASLGAFRGCVNLKELYLRKNAITDLTQVLHLRELPNLKVLWLCDNPVTHLPHYRAFVVRCCPNLTKLDNNDLTPEEVAQAQAQFPSLETLPVGLPMMSEMPAASPLGAQTPPPAQAHRPAQVHAVVDAPREVPCAAAASPNSAKRDNVVQALMFLLDELDVDGLLAVQNCVQAKLAARC